ncbi:MAG TPA: glycosyltransferase [Tepidisphaeraceae bacterium]|jgi:glycosyltransferase involved in cell wall biosynthesis
MRSMRVVHVISGLDRQKGGVVMSLIGLATAQARVGLDVSILSSYQADEDNRAVDELRAIGVKVTMVGPVIRRLAHWSRGNRTAANAAVAAADVAHIHGPWEDIYHQVMRACRQQRKPYVVSAHGMLSPWSMSLSPVRKRLYLALRLRHDLDRAAAIHFTTDEEARQLRPMGLKARPLIQALGLDLTEFETLPPAGTFRAHYPDLAGRTVLIFLGRMHLQKGLEILIPAFAKANAPDARLVLAGPDDGGYVDVVRGLVKQYGVADRVIFTGMLLGRDRVAALADADLFVLTSHQENFGIVVLEALAAGTAALISDRVNFAEHMAGQDVGEVVPCDVDSAARAIERWAADPARRAAAGARARAFALKHYDWLPIAERWKTHYGSVA